MECPECGAADSRCGARFDEFLALEFSDAAYGAVHHLTVAAYMLQHSSRLTREGWLHERALLREFLVEGRPPEVVRRLNRKALDGGRRTFKIRSKDGQPWIARIPWARTILDVRWHDAGTYREDVTAWARCVLEDSESVKF